MKFSIFPAWTKTQMQEQTPSKSSDGTQANAMQHGLTAKVCMPKALLGEPVKEFRERLRRELAPATTIETVLVDEIARHAGMLEVAEAAEGAVLRHGASELASLASSNDSNPQGLEDGLLSAAVATDALERVARYRRMHERALLANLDKFEAIRGARAAEAETADSDTHLAMITGFSTETQCADWLRRRFEQSSWRCAHCGERRGYWLDNRQRWQCRKCGRQHSLRSGTVMERSPIPLVTWFLAIGTILRTPDVTPTELAKTTSVKRQRTARSMSKRIRDALAGNRTSEYLAGLDRYFLANRTCVKRP